LRFTGIVRAMDQLGRIVLPKSLRQHLGIDAGTKLEFLLEDNGSIVIRKYQPGCAFCDSVDDLVRFKGYSICGKCRDEIAAL
jgi:transcriptional pleiotropic regulator of transition state genes